MQFIAVLQVRSSKASQNQTGMLTHVCGLVVARDATHVASSVDTVFRTSVDTQNILLPAPIWALMGFSLQRVHAGSRARAVRPEDQSTCRVSLGAGSDRCVAALGQPLPHPNRSQSGQKTQQQPPYKLNGVTQQHDATARCNNMTQQHDATARRNSASRFSVSPP